MNNSRLTDAKISKCRKKCNQSIESKEKTRYFSTQFVKASLKYRKERENIDNAQ